MTALKQLRALLAKATPGPWGEWSVTDDYAEPRVYEVGVMGPLRMYNDGSGGCTNDFVCETTKATYPDGAIDHNAALIVAMRAALPALLGVAEAAQALRKNTRHPPPYQDDCVGCALDSALAKLSDGMVPNVTGDEK